MTDEVFGELEWGYRDHWEGRATVEPFRGYGAALDQADAEAAAHTKSTQGRRLPKTKRQMDARAQLEARVGKVTAWLMLGAAGVIKWLAQRGGGRRRKEAGAEAQALRESRVELVVEAGGPEETPSEAQRAAWKAVLSRGEAVWDEVLERAAEVYRRQRPMRAWIWRATYGDFGFDLHLPESMAAAEMKPLVRPLTIRVKRPDGEAGTCDIGVHFICTWHVDGFGALIRDGRVVEVGAFDLVHPVKKRPGEVLEHPVFGPLRRIPNDDPWEVVNQWQAPKVPGQSGFDGVKRGGPWPWEGRTRCDTFLKYALAADDRAAFRDDPANAEGPRSAMAWEFAEGTFDLRVYAEQGEPPSDAQTAAMVSFRAGEERCGREIIEGIFKNYLEVCETIRSNWVDRYVDDLVPVLHGPDGLRDLMQLRHVHVHPADADGRVTIAFQFVCTWDTDGFSVMWRDGEIVEWGTWKDAQPMEVA